MEEPNKTKPKFFHSFSTTYSLYRHRRTASTQSTRISPETIARYDLPQIVDPRRQQEHATIVEIRHEDQLPFVDGQMSRNCSIGRLRFPCAIGLCCLWPR